MNLQQVLAIMALPWQGISIGLNRYILTHPDCLGAIIFDEQAQVIYPSNSQTVSHPKIDTDLKFYTDPKYYSQLNSARILQCEGNALNNFKNPERYYSNVFKLFHTMKEKEEEGTEAVFGRYFEDLDGKNKWAWIRVELDDKLQNFAYFENAISDFESAVKMGDEEKIARAENMLKYLTGVNWSRGDNVLMVGQLADGYGWQWLTDTSLCSDDDLNDYGGDTESDVVRCSCDFSHSVSWGLGYTGQYIAEMHRAYLIHNKECVGCQGYLR